MSEEFHQEIIELLETTKLPGVEFHILDPYKPFELVEILIRNASDPRISPVAIRGVVPSFGSFTDDIRRLLSSYRPRPPKVPTKRLPADIMQTFSNRYIKAVEAGASDQILANFRTQLWREFANDHLPKHLPTPEREGRRHNFNSAMEGARKLYDESKTNFRK